MSITSPEIPDFSTMVDSSTVESNRFSFLFDTAASDLKLVTQGAEALLYQTTYLDSNTPAALKFRPSKPYRHVTLDQRLTKQRVLAEARVLVKLSAYRRDAIHVPALLSLEWDVARPSKSTPSIGRSSYGSGAWLLMEWIDGLSVKQLLRNHDSNHTSASSQDVRALLQRIGKAIGQMHFKGGVIHGDLTTSNLMVRQSLNDQSLGMDGDIVLIDFGLAVQSSQDEDRAVDLYVLERAFSSTHPKYETMFDTEVLQDGYRTCSKEANTVLKRLEDVRLRGRKRSMIG